MQPFWTFRLFLAAVGAMALAGSGCGRSASAVHHDGAAGSDAPTSTGGISGGSGGSAGSQSSAGTGGGSATSAGGNGGSASSGAGGSGGTASGGSGGIASGGAGGTVVGGSGGTASGGAGGTATGGAGGTGGSGGRGGTVTGDAGGIGSGGSSGTATGGAGGSAAGGSTGTGGIAGSGGPGGASTGGAGGAGTGGAGGNGAGGSDGGPEAGDSYSGCRYIGGIDRLVVTKTSAQGTMCVTLALRYGGVANTLGLTFPSPWNVESADRWPASIAPCSTRFPSFLVTSHATSGTGTVTVNGDYHGSSVTLDVDAVLNFPPDDAGVSESETLQAKAVPAAGSCSTIVYPDASSG